MRFVITLISCLTIVAYANAQNSSGQSYYSEDIISKVGSKGVDVLSKDISYTGMLDISVPIYEVEIDGFKLPITLRYNPNKLKVNSGASWVGLGWDLDIPGSVSRQVNMFPDDVRKDMIYGNGANFTPYRYGYALEGYNGAPNFTDGWTDYRKTTVQLAILRGHNGNFSGYTGVTPPQKSLDTEPDAFYYKLVNGAGGFVYGYNGVPYKIPFSQVKIEQTYDNNKRYSNHCTYGISKYEITDEEGNLYNLNVTDVDHLYTDIYKNVGGASSLAQLGSSASPAYSYASNWYPSYIRTSNNRYINFTYAAENTEEASATFYARNNTLTIGDTYMGKYTLQTLKHVNNRITKIETDNEIVEFIASHSRQDISGSNALTEIRIYQKINGQTNLLKKIKFSYGYFSTSNDANMQVNGVSPYATTNIIDRTKFLKLLSIQTESSAGNNLPPYTFEYNDQNPLPCRYSVEQDFWGYFNDNNSSHPFPTLYVYPNKSGVNRISVYRRNDWIANSETELVLSGADRSATGAITRGTLKKIFNPLGGYIEYEFEPNQFLWGGENRNGGGMRIKSTKVHDGLSAVSDIITNYSYNKPTNTNSSSGKLLECPLFGYTENALDYTTTPVNYWDYPSNSYNYFNYFCWRLSQPIFNSGLDKGIGVGYETITVSNPVLGKREISYDVPGEYGQTTLDQKYVDNGLNSLYDATPIAKTISGMFTSSNQGYDNQPDNNGVDLNPYSFWAGPRTNFSWARGTVSSIKYYNQLNQLQRSVDYEYLALSGNNQSVVELPSMKYEVIHSANINYQSNSCRMCQTDCWTYSKYKQIANVKMVPFKETTKYYYSGNYLTEEVSYLYNGVKHLYPTKVITKNSKGEYTFINRKYPLDYFSNTPPTNQTSEVAGLYNLVYYNKLNQVVEEWVENKDINNNITTLNAKYNQFKVFPNSWGIAALEKEWLLETPTSISNFSPTTLNALSTPVSLNKDSRYVANSCVLNRDAYSNPLDFELSHGSTAYSYAHNGGYTICKTINSTHDKIYYSSFEDDDDKGNWNYYHPIGTGGDPHVIADPDAITGKNIYYLTPQINPITNVGSLNPSEVYTLSFWYKGDAPVVNPSNSSTATISVSNRKVTRGWNYVEYNISGASQAVIKAVVDDCYIDELRLYPASAQMFTSSYDPVIGKITDCDERNNIIYYEYDEFGNLTLIRDVDKNILKKIQSKIKSQDN